MDFKRLGCVNVVAYDLEPGTYEVESFEPYTMRYMKMLVTEGSRRGLPHLSARLRRIRKSTPRILLRATRG